MYGRLTLRWNSAATSRARDWEPSRTDGQEQGHRVGFQADRQRSVREGRQGIPTRPGGGPGRRPRPPEAGGALPEDEEAVRGRGLLREGGAHVWGAGLLPEGRRALQTGAEGRRARRRQRPP